MDRTEIRQYVIENIDGVFTDKEIEHITMCCEHLYKNATEGYPIGGFLIAIKNNDFRNAVFKADDINIRALKLYAYFTYWNLPS